jgi:hypothetical protein
MNVSEWHEKLLAAALEARRTWPDFRFNLRQRDQSGRLSRGYWFIGNDDYLFFAPFAPRDSVNKTQTIGYCIGFDELGNPKSNYVDIVFKGVANPAHRKIYARMVQELGPFKPQEADHYKRYYLGVDPLRFFQEFMAKDYPRLRAILREANAESEFQVAELDFAAMLERVESLRTHLKHIG